jgi:hypothetical protein
MKVGASFGSPNTYEIEKVTDEKYTISQEKCLK